MFSALWLVRLASTSSGAQRREAQAELEAAARQVPEAQAVLFEPTCSGVYNGGDLLWRAEFRDEVAYRRALASDLWRGAALPLLSDGSRVAGCEHVGYASGAAGGTSPSRGLYRAALFCANHRPTADRLAHFSAELIAMPRYVHSIRRWQLAAATEATGTRPWTHVWEQEYDDLAGLAGPYMMHPCHWSQVDRWFDPEEPDWLVDPVLCHTYCNTTAPVIGAGASAASRA